MDAIGELSTKVPRHHYSLGVISIALQSVLDGCQSFYASSWVIQLLSCARTEVQNAPSYAAIRLWLLRLGLYQLMRPLERADDWVWIVDHTMQIGDMKCLIILGVRRCSWETSKDRRLQRKDMQTIALLPVRESTGEVIAQQFRETAQRCGVPQAIVSDDGRDLHRGLALYRAEQPGTCWIYDIKHKTAALLKRTLEPDPEWNSFTKEVTRTKQQVVLTPLAFLLPPQQRGKARYMNIDTLVSWGVKTLAFLDDPQAAVRHGVASEVLQEKLGWLQRYRDALQNWAEAMQVIETTEHYVRTEGIHRRIVPELRSQLKALRGGQLSRRFRVMLLVFLRHQARLCQIGQRLPGSSEVLESVIGQYKHLQGERSPHGLTAMVLSIAANVGERTTTLLKNAMETVGNKALFQWCRQHLGISVQSQRKMAFSRQTERTTMANVLDPIAA